MHDLNKGLLFGALFALVTGSLGADELSGHVGVFNNYLWRGVSYTDDSAAVQGGLDYVTATGAYLGTWVSNLAAGQGQQVDLYAGMTGQLGAIVYDVGLYQLTYPLIADRDSTEIYGAIGYGVFSLGLWTEIDSSRAGDNALGSYYLEGNFVFALPNIKQTDFKLHAGYWFTNEREEGFNNYLDYSANVVRHTELGDFSLGLYGNSLEQGDRYFDAPRERFSDRPRVVIGWSRRFDF